MLKRKRCCKWVNF